MHHEIEFKEVVFEYPEKKFGLYNITFNIGIGTKFAVCGRNGAGKTTLLRILMGLEEHQAGNIKVQELTLNRENIKEVRKRIGFVFQNPDSQVFSASVYEDVAFGPRNLGLEEEEVEKRVEEALKSVDLLDCTHESPFRLSFGQRKRVAIAGVLSMDPSIIILDEPFSNLDYPTRTSLKKLLENSVLKRGKTIIFTTHYRKLINEWADSVLFLDAGKILYHGNVEDLSIIDEADRFLGPF
ncbi:MAG: ABC transporter ATP-binding protein [Asgard group archaeon]|nr:ABC transporter ATP-binding protein [Asgard group archaeon]